MSLATVLVVAALLGFDVDVSSPRTPTATAQTRPALAARNGTLATLAGCTACHVDDALTDAGQVGWARAPQRIAPPLTGSASPSATRVRSGGQVYVRACATCHARAPAAARDANGLALVMDSGPADASVSSDASVHRASPDAHPALSDDELAALAAFLQRHMATALLARRPRPTL